VKPTPKLYIFYRGFPLMECNCFHDNAFTDDRSKKQYWDWTEWYSQTVEALAELKMAAYLRMKETDEQNLQRMREGNLRERRLRVYEKLKREFEEEETPKTLPLDRETLKQIEDDLTARWGHCWGWLNRQPSDENNE